MLCTSLSLSALALASVPAAPHDDDPKVLDRRPAYQGPGYRSGAPASAGLKGGGSFLTGEDGPALDFPSSDVTLLSWITLGELGSPNGSGNDCWGYVSPSGREYAIMGTSGGTAFVEITDPTYAEVIAFVPGPGSLWRDIKVYEHYAYAVSENPSGGIQVIDLDQIDQGVVSDVGTVLTGGTGRTHNVAIDTTSGFLYRTGGENHGLRIYDLSDPANPSYVASWNNRYVHDAQVVTYTSGPYAGRQIAFLCSGYNGGSSQTRFEILDVTSKSSMFVRDTVFYSHNAYSHQVWTSPDLQYAYLDDEKDEGGGFPTTTYVIDISDLDQAFQAGSFTNGSSAIGHNLYVTEDHVYEANYRSGLRVFTRPAPGGAQEVAWFDTWPGDDKSTFNGLWSCYPYFPSGVVIGSDLEKGLFVWWVGEPAIDFEYPSGAPGRLDPAGDSVDVRILEASAGDLVAGTETLHVDSGSGYVGIPLASLGGDLYRADFPAIDCGSQVRWYVSAESASGIEWRSPAGSPATAHRSWSGFSESGLLEDDMETDLGWGPAPGDDALHGIWERGEPGVSLAGPPSDHTPSGTDCWLTGLDSTVGLGTTSLVSPPLALAGTANPVVSYWRWYAKDLGPVGSNDRFFVYVSGDGGDSWVEVERIQGKVVEAKGGWYYHEFAVRDFVQPSDQVRIKFVASDLGYDSIIEAAVDDFRVRDFHCDCDGNQVEDDVDIQQGDAADCNANGVPDACDIASGTSADADGDGVPDECACVAESYCVAGESSIGEGASIGMSGSASLSSADFTLTVEGAVPGQFGIFFYGPTAASAPFGEGVLCIGSGGLGLFRLPPPEPAESDGSAARGVDFDDPPAGSGPGAIQAGSTWYFQYWYRDPLGGGAGFNLSDGLRVTFCN